MYQLQCTEWTDLHNGLTSHIYHVTNYCNGIIAIVYTSVELSGYVITSYLSCATSHIYHVTNYCNGIIAIVYTSVELSGYVITSYLSFAMLTFT